MHKAEKKDWKTEPISNDLIQLPITRISFNLNEYDKMKYGFIPSEMEDKWFIYFENNNLYFYRSWTGILVFLASFTLVENEVLISEIKMNPKINKDETKIDLEYEIKLVLFLIKRILLAKDTEFPINPNIKIENNMQYWMHRHGMVGNSNSNDSK